VFIAVGELALFVALADSWQLRSRAAAWTVTALGVAMGVAAGVDPERHGDRQIAGHAVASVF
jgi:hypothetical protein